MTSRRFWTALTAVVVLVGVVVGLTTGVLAEAAGRGLHATGLWSSNGASTVSPGTFDAPASTRPQASSSPAPDLPAAVLTPATSTGSPSPRRVARRIEAVDDEEVGGRYAAQVAGLGSGDVLYSHRAGAAAIPASTLKLLTATAALNRLGPDHTFATTVVRSGTRLVLVGGGDPYLTRTASRHQPRRASLEELAAGTARALARTRTKEVTLGYDTSLFSGPAWNPTWPDGYADQVTPVSALWVDEGRVNGGSPGPRVADPAGDAARVFAAALEERGVRVSAPQRRRAPAGARPVATVRSMPLAQVVEKMLMASDNDGAEVLLRQVALAGHHAGSTAAGVKAVRAELAGLGIRTGDLRLVDGSGLSRQNRVPARTLVQVLRTAASAAHPDLRAVVTGLPVAGVEGSLAVHYTDARSEAGRGVVRAKTGTLSQVHALAGYLRTEDGTLVAFAFLVDEATDDYAAKVWLDRVSTALSRCGC